jgi:arginyl-tRNA synthetase
MIGPAQLADAVRRGLAAAGLPDREPTFERPRNPDHGDWSTNVALSLAKPVGAPPREVAQRLVDALGTVEGVEAVEIAGPGFVNFRLAADAFGAIVRGVVEAGADAWGRSDAGAGRSVDVEFVSANPTGPLHAGHIRGAAAGDAIARLLEATGWAVTREYYVNDAGNQMRLYGQSLQARMRGEDPPEDGYHGVAVTELAGRLLSDGVDPDDADAVLEAGYRATLEQIAGTLARFGVRFDVWTSERELHSSGAIRRTIDALLERGEAYEADGATWLRTSAYGDDKDRVLVKADGSLTYFAADTAYLAHKAERGFDRLVYVLGADHHGYIGRLLAIARAEGQPEGLVEVVIGQLVNLLREGEAVRMSKRTGEGITFDEVIDEVGADAARYTYLRTSIDTTLDFDLARVVEQDKANPVHYINYSYARISGIARTAAERGFDPGAVDEADLGLLGHDTELELIRRIDALPEVVARAAEDRAPHRVARYAEDLADAFHRFYTECQVLGEDEALSRARYWLCEAARISVAAALGLLGVTPRERM